MEPKRLSDDELADIRARAAGKQRYGPAPDFRDTPSDIHALLRHVAALEDENARLREALVGIKILPMNYAATTALPRIIPGMTEAGYEHGILEGFSVAAEMARAALEGDAS
jgi:hypothetical protein